MEFPICGRPDLESGGIAGLVRSARWTRAGTSRRDVPTGTAAKSSTSAPKPAGNATNGRSNGANREDYAADSAANGINREDYAAASWTNDAATRANVPASPSNATASDCPRRKIAPARRWRMGGSRFHAPPPPYRKSEDKSPHSKRSARSHAPAPRAASWTAVVLYRFQKGEAAVGRIWSAGGGLARKRRRAAAVQDASRQPHRVFDFQFPRFHGVSF